MGLWASRWFDTPTPSVLVRPLFGGSCACWWGWRTLLCGRGDGGWECARFDPERGHDVTMTKSLAGPFVAGWFLVRMRA